MISMDKNYRTKDGKKVRFYAIDGYGHWPVHGAVLHPDGWYSFTWSEDGDGRFGSATLIEVVMIPEYWVVFESDGMCSHVTSKDPNGYLSDGQFSIHHPAQEKPHV